jgi:hypothetical protein
MIEQYFRFHVVPHFEQCSLASCYFEPWVHFFYEFHGTFIILIIQGLSCTHSCTHGNTPLDKSSLVIIVTYCAMYSHSNNSLIIPFCKFLVIH